jgi:hypothetical protein
MLITMQLKWMSLMLGAGLFMGCQLGRIYDSDGVALARFDDGYFHLYISPDVANRVKKPDSPEAKSLIEIKVRESGICRDGYVILSQGIGRGDFNYTGRCL